jgi:hypothetical protein
MIIQRLTSQRGFKNHSLKASYNANVLNSYISTPVTAYIACGPEAIVLIRGVNKLFAFDIRVLRSWNDTVTWEATRMETVKALKAINAVMFGDSDRFKPSQHGSKEELDNIALEMTAEEL